MVVNGRPMKRMKRRVTVDLHDFLTFPSAGDGISVELDGPFRSNVRSFLSKHARMPSMFAPALFPHLMTWQIAFRIGESNGQDATIEPVVALDVVEEDVTASRSVYCDHCRVVGWSGHPVCWKRYHFIIRADSCSVDGYHRPCTQCGALLHSLDLRCKSCNYQITSDDLEDWLYMQLADTTHLLHGVVHVNGYGHLLRINGREGGSKFLSGCHIMDFWDRLCKMLRVRKMSVMDVSKKYGLEYRLFHAITSDRPWYGGWGYEFGAGSFGHTADTYRQAVKTLSNMPLASLLAYDRKPWTRLQDIVALYMCLSEHRLATFRDLFRFILAQLHSIHKAGASSKNPEQQPAAPREKDDIQRVEHAMVKILRAVGESRWVPWRALRRAACGAGPPELLDYCLKGIGGKSFDGRVVHTRCNPQTEAIEYSVKDGNAADACDSIPDDSNAANASDSVPVDSNAANASDSVPDDSNAANASDSVPNAKLPSLNYITEDHLRRDLKFLYDALLNPETMLCYRPQVTRERALNSAVNLLDCKQFVKNYESDFIKIPSTSVMRVWCRIVFDNQPKGYIAAPPELLVLPVSATVADLKSEAKKALRETYILFKRLEVEQLLDYGDVGDSTHVMFLVGFEGSVRLRGRCFVNHALDRFRMERGTEKWTVDCTCGASDDDGERMLTCDSCGVWQHTRCSGIPDSQVVPSKFVCAKCRNLSKSKAAGSSKRLKCQTDDVRAVGNEMIVWTPSTSFGQ